MQRPAAPTAQREGRGPAPLSPPPATPSPSPPSPSPPARRVQGLAPPPEPRLRPPPVLCRGAIPGQHDCAPPRPRRALPRHARARAPGLRRPLRAGIAHAAAAASSISPLIGHTASVQSGAESEVRLALHLHLDASTLPTRPHKETQTQPTSLAGRVPRLRTSRAASRASTRPSRGTTPRGPSRSHVLRRRPNVASRATPSSAGRPSPPPHPPAPPGILLHPPPPSRPG